MPNGDTGGTHHLSYQELLQLVELIKSSSHFTEFRVRSGDFELELRRGGADESAAVRASVAPGAAPAPPTTVNGHVHSDRAGAALAAGAIVIDSPMVGTFYRAPEPGAAPFVEVGNTVEAGSTVCIIEVMKLMNSIVAPCRGKVAAILAGDGDAVQYGQRLIVIDPS